MSETVNILFIGDVIGDPGYNILKSLLPGFITKYKIDFTIANAENITEGVGILQKDAVKLLDLGIDVLTGGNHTMDKIQTHKFISEAERLLRPLNYPRGAYGRGYGIFQVTGKMSKIAVINLQGRTFMKPIDCPFRSFDFIYEKIKNEARIIFVDFHAETTSEKIAFGWHSDGRVSAVIGTHTHVQTADERILPNGTAYLTDAGMTGPYDSVIGMKTESSLKRFIYATPQKHEVATENIKIAGVVLKIDADTGKAISVERILYPPF